jgi:hypothetical protein
MHKTTLSNSLSLLSHDISHRFGVIGGPTEYSSSDLIPDIPYGQITSDGNSLIISPEVMQVFQVKPIISALKGAMTR